MISNICCISVLSNLSLIFYIEINWHWNKFLKANKERNLSNFCFTPLLCVFVGQISWELKKRSYICVWLCLVFIQYGFGGLGQEMPLVVEVHEWPFWTFSSTSHTATIIDYPRAAWSLLILFPVFRGRDKIEDSCIEVKE